jgi:hypothetical protein
MRSPRAALLGLLAPLLVAGAVVAGDPPDPGVVLEVDRTQQK